LDSFMNKKFLSSVLLTSAFVTSIAFANTKIELDGKEIGCSKKSEELFHCESGGKRILVVKNHFGFIAYEKNGTEVPTLKSPTKVTDGIKILYEVPKLPGFGSSGGGFGGMMGGYTAPDTKAMRLTVANGVVNNLKDVQDDWAKEFVSDSKKFIDEEKITKSKARLIAGGKDFDCSRGENKPLTAEEENIQAMYGIKMECNFYACTSPSGEKILGYFPAAGAYAQPFVVKLNGSETEFKIDDIKVYDSSNKASLPLYDVPKYQTLIGGYSGTGGGIGLSGAIDYSGTSEQENEANLLIPSKFEKNYSTFQYYTNPQSAQMRGELVKQCIGDNDTKKFIDEEQKIADSFIDDLTKMELGHYLTMVNGQMLALVVDPVKANGKGCLYGDMIVSKKAQEHLSYLQKANIKPVEKTISEQEVQELFKKAKNMADIPFGYKYDGCYARAHVMARRFEAMGIPTEKVWIKGSLFVPNTDIQWNYHVAPVINVKTKSGEIVKYAIDPSLNDKAVPVDEWVATMGKNVKGGVMKTSYPFPVNVAQYQRTAVALSSSDVYVPDNDEKRSEEQNMGLAIQTMKNYSQALKEAQNEKNNSVEPVL
jgi:hypothetical protein